MAARPISAFRDALRITDSAALDGYPSNSRLDLDQDWLVSATEWIIQQPLRGRWMSTMNNDWAGQADSGKNPVGSFPFRAGKQTVPANRGKDCKAILHGPPT